MRFRVNRPDTVHESFEDEVVLLNLKSGNYYSLDEAGALIWNYLECGQSDDEMVQSLAAHYGAAEVAVRGPVLDFLAELQQEALVLPEAGAEDSPVASSIVPAKDGTGAAVFSAPQLRRYTDMQELFLIDPIHEVQDSGWPRSLEESQA